MDEDHPLVKIYNSDEHGRWPGKNRFTASFQVVKEDFSIFIIIPETPIIAGRCINDDFSNEYAVGFWKMSGKDFYAGEAVGIILDIKNAFSIWTNTNVYEVNITNEDPFTICVEVPDGHMNIVPVILCDNGGYHTISYITGKLTPAKGINLYKLD